MIKNICLQNMRKLGGTENPLFMVRMFLLLITIISCSDDETNQAPLNTGLLSASTANVIIDDNNLTGDAVNFSWHAEKTPIIQYNLILTANGNTDSVDVGSDVNKKFIHAELNAILTSKLKLEIGKAANVDVQVVAKAISNKNTGISNVLTISVTPSTPTTPPSLEPVVLVASKNDVNVDMENPLGETVSFTWGPTERNVFIQYKLILKAGSATATVDVLSDVSKEFTNAELNSILIDKLHLAVGVVASVKVQLQARVTINDETSVSDISISAKPAADPVAPAYTKLWIVGNATPNGWDIGNPNVMVNDPINIYQFKYNEVLNAEEFKIPVGTGNWDGDFYMPPTDHPDLSSTSVKLIPTGHPDNKWKIDHAGPYKILINISSNPFIKISAFTPYENLYITGDATPAGWDINSAIAMTADANDPNIFTWTGELKSTGRGQFRFLISTDDSNESFFVAPSSGASITETKLAFTSNSTPPNNFKVKGGEDGIYTITINQFKETISIVKQQ